MALDNIAGLGSAITAMTQLSPSTRRKVAAAVLLGGGAALYFRQQAAKRAAAKRRKEKEAAGGSSAAPKKSRQDPMVQIIKLLWPFGKGKRAIAKDPDANVGRSELIAIFLVSCLRTWHQNRMVFVKRDLMSATCPPPPPPPPLAPLPRLPPAPRSSTYDDDVRYQHMRARPP